MYSVVLMMALSGSADVPAFGHRGGCCGGGCYGGYASCSGGCYGGGYGCSGSCHGGRAFRHRGHGCHGCSGGGYGCCGSYGGCYGGGCYGGCYGGGYGGCYGGGYGGCYGGGYGGCYGGGCYGGGVMVAPQGEMRQGEGGTRTKPEQLPKKKTTDGDSGTMAPAPATLIVSLPAEAKLTVDDRPTLSTSATRQFSSPALEPGKEYYYNLKAEITRDGKPLTISKQVTVHAGDETRVSLEFPVDSLAQR
jgi:uncharacterized protein (TIGR03000 family)